MPFEYTAIPAPTRGEKAREARTPTDRYARALAAELNRMAADGWEYLRADVLPSEERSGLTGRNTVYHNLLIFRRLAAPAQEEKAPQRYLPQPEYPVAASPARAPEPRPHIPDAAAPRPADPVAGSGVSAPSRDDHHQTDATPPAPRKSPADQD
ncbi:DUF4177 domain-containing protein [Paracoccus spongiarum]|uniref:DUF4177 domain-containing protein n=1 Tax=Paracoccus spongiarum TaxID=3064387 RepID=A0ABT9J956_9RHOB|nr:DUF4177 domain-containing protein [Paracoccus sp. 2205BS29-5]MDP5306344.1 DUF4177 domain-containing protein [Paracoccus sp. 2205BS29-5]